MLQGVLHRASRRGFTPYYYDLEIPAEKAQYDLIQELPQRSLPQSPLHGKT